MMIRDDLEVVVATGAAERELIRTALPEARQHRVAGHAAGSRRSS